MSITVHRITQRPKDQRKRLKKMKSNVLECQAEASITRMALNTAIILLNSIGITEMTEKMISPKVAKQSFIINISSLTKLTQWMAYKRKNTMYSYNHFFYRNSIYRQSQKSSSKLRNEKLLNMAMIQPSFTSSKWNMGEISGFSQVCAMVNWNSL